MTEPGTRKQWEQVIDAVIAAGGKANWRQVWEHLKRIRPDTPASTVSPTLNSLAVNSPARTSYHTGREPRRSDTGHRYDSLFKLGGGDTATFVLYDPKVHGVWEVYPNPLATSTHRMSIRPVSIERDSLTVLLSDGAIKPGNSFFPVKSLDQNFFPEDMFRSKNPDVE